MTECAGYIAFLLNTFFGTLAIAGPQFVSCQQQQQLQPGNVNSRLPSLVKQKAFLSDCETGEDLLRSRTYIIADLSSVPIYSLYSETIFALSIFSALKTTLQDDVWAPTVFFFMTPMLYFKRWREIYSIEVWGKGVPQWIYAEASLSEGPVT